MDRVFFAIGCALGLLGVALGAFGAHALKGRLPPELLATFDTAVRYQLAHAPALLAVAWASTCWPGRAVRVQRVRPPAGRCRLISMKFWASHACCAQPPCVCQSA